MLGHTILTHVWAPLRVRSSARVGRMLAGFALAELGSALTLRWAAAREPDLDRRLAYLRHALDEERHGAMFARRAAELGERVAFEAVTAEDLHGALGEGRFLAFVTMAEGRGRREFAAYERALVTRGDARTAAILAAVQRDEARHEAYSRALLEEVTRWPRGTIAGVMLWESSRAARRGGDRLGRALYRGLLAVVYVTLLPLVWLLLRERPPR